MDAPTIAIYRPDPAGPLKLLLRAFLAKARRAFELAGAPYATGALPL